MKRCEYLSIVPRFFLKLGDADGAEQRHEIPVKPEAPSKLLDVAVFDKLYCFVKIFKLHTLRMTSRGSDIYCFITEVLLHHKYKITLWFKDGDPDLDFLRKTQFAFLNTSL